MRKPFDGDYPITQLWGENPDMYAQFGLKGHDGIDYGTPTGTEILAPHGGQILEATYDQYGYGNYIKIENDKEGSVLGHLQEFKVKAGNNVIEGQIIGISDNTGNSTGPHLHWGYYTKPRNRDDGYAGFINQLPLINQNPAIYTEAQMTVVRLDRDKNWTLYQDALTQVKQREERISGLEKEVDDLKQKYENEQKHSIELNSQLADASSLLEKIKSESKDYGTQILEAQHKADEAVGLLDRLNGLSGCPTRHENIKDEYQCLSKFINDLEAPHTQTVKEYLNLGKALEDYFYKRVPRGKGILEKIKEYLKEVGK